MIFFNVKAKPDPMLTILGILRLYRFGKWRLHCLTCRFHLGQFQFVGVVIWSVPTELAWGKRKLVTVLTTAVTAVTSSSRSVSPLKVMYSSVGQNSKSFIHFSVRKQLERQWIGSKLDFGTRGLAFESRDLRSLCARVAQSRPEK